MKEEVLLFDLDGTLTDSAEGITRSVSWGLAALGITADPEALRGFIGPPLTWSFPHFYGLNAEQTQAAIARFRERYETVGKFENRVYPGIPELLTALRGAGYRLGVATSKPEHFAVEIVGHFGLAPYFEHVAGSSPDESGCKADVVRDALGRFGVTPDRALMIGDREHDIDGAHAVGVRAVGVLWGYGTEQELLSHSADRIVATPGELLSYLA